MEKRIRKYFIILIAGLLLVILISGIILFNNTMQKVYIRQMEQTNKNLVQQISSSFELVIKQISDQVNKLAIYESDFESLVQKRKLKITNSIKLYDELKQIVMGNQYIHSVYLYSEDEGVFFDSKRGNCFRKEKFFDRAVIDAVTSKYLTTVPPHKVNNDVLIYSVIVPLKSVGTKARCVLSVNIDVGQLYKDVMKSNTGDKEINLYVYDENNKILISRDYNNLNKSIMKKQKEIDNAFPSRSFWSVLNKKVGVMDAVTYSSSLKSYFYVQVPFSFNFSKMFNNYFLLVIILLLFVTAVIIAYIILCFTTKPIKEVLTDYNDKLMKDMLTGSCHGKDKLLPMASNMEKFFKYNNYSLLLIDVNDNQLEIYKTVSLILEELSAPAGNLVMKPISIFSNRVAIIVNYNNNSVMEQLTDNYLRQFYQKLNEKYYQQVYIAVSSGKTDPALLSIAYMECDEIQQYKLSITDHIINYRWFQERKSPIIYPVELEKQLINNLLVKNTEGCIFYTEKFLKHIFEEGGLLTDIQIKNYIYQLQNEILTRISSLPISIKTSGSSDMKNIHSRSQIHDILLNFIQSICSEIAKKNPNNESIINEAIIEYIDSNLTENDFNLNSISYQFNMNRNYLAKLIKEETSYSFNDYVNMKKISLAKELLSTTMLTVEEISHRTGFSYAHYFIKVFKNMEGITPGQFREMQINNNNA
ncbi:AraC family transcriptional regulator [Anaerocolumna sp. MB42-C2]|uniref:AraC family transcriptional regulator n=1 Tax=Anaerocolumna sp. MB42-C2 TaxID=3070997 RepID=UPI0027E10BF6|nr:AraC family transcriptional regulator [Anaerocolumna sp. MB42-C2]WMJ89729.1 AraC family transcriptional regulator [Anaerocolumna sp. MB42-C2]